MVRRIGSLAFVLALLPLLGGCGVASPSRDASASPAPTVALTSAERSWLAAHGPLQVAAFVDYAPFGSVDERGVPVGFAVDLWGLVADRLDTMVEFSAVPFPDQVAGLQEGRFDSTAGFLILEGRKAAFAFSRPFQTVTTGIYVDPAHADRTSIAALAGLTVAVVQDDSSQVTAEAAGLATLVVGSYLESLLAVADGRAQAVIMDPPVADYYIGRDVPVGKVVLAGTPAVVGEVGFPVRKDQTVLLGILDKALASIGQAEIDALLARWVGGR